ncbi:MAG: ribosome-associated translation inhibitor RaiA [Alphaproteobacteria bacterium]
MALRVSGKNFDIGEALRQRVTDRVSEATKRFMDGRVSGQVTIDKEAHGFRSHVVLHLPTGSTLQGEAFASDAHQACDGAIDRVEKRLKRYNERLKSRAGTAPPALPEAATYVIEAPDDEDHDVDPGGFEPVIIAESTAKLRQMTVAEAVIELDLTGARVMVFRHAGHGRVNFVYRRADGHVGWVDPPVVSPDSAA